MARKTTLDAASIDASENGFISVRINLTGRDDARSEHRFSLAPGGDLDADLMAVDADLKRGGFLPMSAEQHALVKSSAAAHWTPERVAAFRAEEVKRRSVVAPEPVPLDPLRPLEPDQFWGLLRATGYEQPILDYVETIPDPTEKAFVSAKLQFAKHYERHHPFVEAASKAIGISAAELDMLWAYGQPA